MLLEKSIVAVLLALVLIAQGQSYSGDSVVAAKALELNIKTTTPVVAKGQAVVLQIRTTNIGKQKLRFLETSPAQDFRIKVRDSRSRLRPLTKAGRMATSGVAFRRIIQELLPGKSASYTLIISRYIDMSAPGKYTVFLERDFIVGDNRAGVGKTARSNSIEVTVGAR